MKTFHFVAVAFVFAFNYSFGQDNAKIWLRFPSELNWSDWKELPQSAIYEVVASKEAVALYGDLKNKEFIPLSEEKAAYFTGSYFHLKPEERPFLFRTVYGQGGTGHYTLYRKGDSLLIFHGSLGHASAYHRSAIIANLPFTPIEVYRIVDIAE